MKNGLIVLLICCSIQAINAQNIDKMSIAALDSMVMLLYPQGRYEEAIVYAQKSLAKARQLNNDSIYASSINNLASMYYMAGNYEATEPLFLQAMAVRKKTLGEHHSDYATSLNNLAALYKVMGKFEAAEPLFLKAAAIRKKVLGEEHPDYAGTLNNLAGLYAVIEKYEAAESIYLQAAAIRKKVFGEEHPTYAGSLNNLALLYETMNKLEDAEALYLQANEINKKALGENHPTYATVMNNLASLYKKTGKLEAAESLYLSAKKTLKKSLGENHSSYASTLNNLALLYEKMDKFEAAEALFSQTKDIYIKILNENHPNYITSLNNLAVLYVRMGKFESAKKCFAQAISANCKDRKADSLTFGNDLSILLQKEFYSNIQLIRTISGICELSKALYDQTGNKADLEYNYAALEVAMQLNENIRHSLSGEEDKLRVLKEMGKLAKNAIQTGVLLSENKNKTYVEDAFSYAEQNKSVLLADAVKGQRARALGDLPDSLAVYEISLQNKKKQLEKAEIEAKDEGTRQKVQTKLNELNLEIDAFLKSIKGKYPKYHNLKYANITAKATDVQALLDGKTLFLEYFIADSTVYLFAIQKDKVELFPISIDKNTLSQKIADLRRALSDYDFIKKDEEKAVQLLIGAAHWFYIELLAIALKDKKVENLLIVTDGELGHLPFETFLVEKPEATKTYSDFHYLLKDYNISYNYSATLWKENLANKNVQQNHQILACAATYGGVNTDLEQLRLPQTLSLRSSLAPLKAAQDEVMALSKNFQGKFLFAEAANERSFKELAGKYAIIHLAMHGLLNPKFPMLSSLAFTEDKDSVEDNFLQAYEIARLKLHADLVVLSACETGYGKFEQGEGIVSLARSFMYAGTPSLVVSLWPVNDFSTELIMKLFYQNLAKGMAKDAALRQAKLEYIQSVDAIAAHPAFWAPFVQLGDSRPISIAVRGGGSLIWWIGAGLVLLLGLVVVALRRRKK